MPTFHYQAIDKQGRSLSGVMPALDESNLENKLKELGLWLTEAAKEKAAGPTSTVSKADLFWFRFRGKRYRRQMIEFCTLMTFQARVGVPLVKALEAASADCKDPVFRSVLKEVQAHVEAGQQFYEALGHFPTVFTPHFICVIRAGESSGKLTESFQNLREYLEWVNQVLADVRQATMYPIIVMTVIAAFVLLLFTFVIPKFAELLDKLHVPQPMLTQVVFMVGAIAKATWWIWLPAFIAVVVGIPLGRRFSKRFAFATDALKLRLPVFGELNSMLALSRFAHNLAILYRSGLPILQTLKLCQQGLIGNLVIEKAVGEIEEELKAGSTISEAMRQRSVFPIMVLRMVAMGEATGNLDHALENVTDYYNDMIPRRIKAVFGVLEPALMLFLIFLVGAVALAIYLPIISLMGSIR